MSTLEPPVPPPRIVPVAIDSELLHVAANLTSLTLGLGEAESRGLSPKLVGGVTALSLASVLARELTSSSAATTRDGALEVVLNMMSDPAVRQEVDAALILGISLFTAILIFVANR